MTKTHINRLRKLGMFLITDVPKSKFDMDYIFLMDENKKLTDKVSASCGTAACAMGWATTVFPKELKIDSFDPMQPSGRPTIEYGICHVPSGKRDFAAAAVFFGLMMSEVSYLFGADANRGKSAARIGVKILRFCRKKEKSLQPVAEKSM